jgi:hypothetical protein
MRDKRRLSTGRWAFFSNLLVVSTKEDIHPFKTHHYGPILIKNFYQRSDNASIRF